MKVLIISTHRLPTNDNGGNGLGRHVYDFMYLISQKQDEIHIFCHPDSVIKIRGVTKFNYTDPKSDLDKIYFKIKQDNYDLIIDNSHCKLLSRIYHKHNLPIINFVHDTECTYQPKNILLGNKHQQIQHPSGLVVPTGILFESYDLQEEKDDYYCFVGKIEHRKAVDKVVQVQKTTGKRIIFIGGSNSSYSNILNGQEWLGEITDRTKLNSIVSRSKGLLYLSRLDAGGLAIWEASAMGTPSFVIDGTGTKCNVIDKVSGFICKNVEEVCSLIVNESVNNLDPRTIREETEKIWNLKKNFNNFIYPLFLEVTKGKRW